VNKRKCREKLCVKNKYVFPASGTVHNAPSVIFSVISPSLCVQGKVNAEKMTGTVLRAGDISAILARRSPNAGDAVRRE